MQNRIWRIFIGIFFIFLRLPQLKGIKWKGVDCVTVPSPFYHLPHSLFVSIFSTPFPASGSRLPPLRQPTITGLEKDELLRGYFTPNIYQIPNEIEYS